MYITERVHNLYKMCLPHIRPPTMTMTLFQCGSKHVQGWWWSTQDCTADHITAKFFCFYYNHESDTQLRNLQDVLWSVNALLSALVHDRNLGLLLSTTPGRSEEFVGHKTAEKAALLTGAIAQRCCGAVSPSLIKLYCGEDRPCWTMTFLVPLRKRTGWHSALRGP